MAPKYARETTIEAILGYYEFLTTIPAFPKEAIEKPPVGGWPDITSEAESFANLHKNEVVLDLIRNLPHITGVDFGNAKIAYETLTIDYNSNSVRSRIENNNRLVGSIIPVCAGELPSHVAVLTKGGRYGSWLLLDTQEGTVTDYVMMERPERDTPPVDSPDHWRAYKTLPIVEFFDSWKEKFRSLSWVALAHRGDDDMLLNHDTDTEAVREIYRRHGWPDAYRREEFQQALVHWDRN